MDQTQVAMVSVPERQERKYPFAVMRFVDFDHAGSLWNHLRALEWAARQNVRIIIMEDDAMPVDGFLRTARTWLDLLPDELVSFYLGRGAPVYRQREIASKITDAEKRGADTVKLDGLLHGVCYSVPTMKIPGMLVRITNVGRLSPSDATIGEAWRAETGRDVVYTLPSLVEHDCTLPCIHQHRGRRPSTKRRAWRLP